MFITMTVIAIILFMVGWKRWFILITYVLFIFPLSFIEGYEYEYREVNRYEVNGYSIYIGEREIRFNDAYSRGLMDGGEYKLVGVIEKNIWGYDVIGGVKRYKIIN
jgi:hypothetical protein